MSCDIILVPNMPVNQMSKGLILAAIVLASMTVAYSITTGYVSLHSTGTVKGIGVGVYTNSSCTQRVTSLDWGMAENGTVKTTTVYIRNEGNTPVTLSLQTANWSPSNASTYISLTWNYSGSAIGVNNGVVVVLSLSIASNIQGIPAFNFDIIISAVG